LIKVLGNSKYFLIFVPLKAIKLRLKLKLMIIIQIIKTGIAHTDMPSSWMQNRKEYGFDGDILVYREPRISMNDGIYDLKVIRALTGITVQERIDTEGGDYISLDPEQRKIFKAMCEPREKITSEAHLALHEMIYEYFGAQFPKRIAYSILSNTPEEI